MLEWKVNLIGKWTSLLEATMLIKFLMNNAGLAACNAQGFLIKKRNPAHLNSTLEMPLDH